MRNMYVFQRFLDGGISACLTAQPEQSCSNSSSGITGHGQAEIVSKWPKCRDTQLMLYLWSEHNPPKRGLHRDRIELNWCYTVVGWHRQCYSYGHGWVPCFRTDLWEFHRKVSKMFFWNRCNNVQNFEQKLLYLCAYYSLVKIQVILFIE